MSFNFTKLFLGGGEGCMCKFEKLFIKKGNKSELSPGVWDESSLYVPGRLGK